MFATLLRAHQISQKCGHEGGDRRRLPCRHTYGKSCISKLFVNLDTYSYCRTQYKLIRGQDPGFAATSITFWWKVEVEAPGWAFLRNVFFLILTSVAVAVVILPTMDVHFTLEDENGNEARMFRDANFLTKSSVVPNVLLLSPVIYGCILWECWTTRCVINWFVWNLWSEKEPVAVWKLRNDKTQDVLQSLSLRIIL